MYECSTACCRGDLFLQNYAAARCFAGHIQSVRHGFTFKALAWFSCSFPSHCVVLVVTSDWVYRFASSARCSSQDSLSVGRYKIKVDTYRSSVSLGLTRVNTIFIPNAKTGSKLPVIGLRLYWLILINLLFCKHFCFKFFEPFQL